MGEDQDLFFAALAVVVSGRVVGASSERCWCWVLLAQLTAHWGGPSTFQSNGWQILVVTPQSSLIGYAVSQRPRFGRLGLRGWCGAVVPQKSEAVPLVVRLPVVNSKVLGCPELCVVHW